MLRPKKVKPVADEVVEDISPPESPRDAFFKDKDGNKTSINACGIHWRDLVDKKYLYINQDYYTKRGIHPPDNIEDAPDEGVVVKLAGLKDLAIAHGYSNIIYSNIFTNESVVTLSCQIYWKSTVYNGHFGGNYPSGVTTEGVASATPENVGGGANKYLATIASNRAFARAVRDYFGIFSVTDEELDKTDLEKISMEQKADGTITDINPNKKLQETVEKKLKIDSFMEFRDKFLMDNREEIGLDETFTSWMSYLDIDINVCRKLTGFINKRGKKK